MVCNPHQLARTRSAPLHMPPTLPSRELALREASQQCLHVPRHRRPSPPRHLRAPAGGRLIGKKEEIQVVSSTILNALLNLLNLQGRAGGTARGEREDERSGSHSGASGRRAGRRRLR